MNDHFFPDNLSYGKPTEDRLSTPLGWRLFVGGANDVHMLREVGSVASVYPIYTDSELIRFANQQDTFIESSVKFTSEGVPEGNQVVDGGRHTKHIVYRKDGVGTSRYKPALPNPNAHPCKRSYKLPTMKG